EFFFRVVLKDWNYEILDDIFIFRRMHNSQLSFAANKSQDKTLMKFSVNQLNFENFTQSGLRDRGVIRYFRGFFLRFSYRLLKERKFLASVQSAFLLIKASFRYK